MLPNEVTFTDFNLSSSAALEALLFVVFLAAAEPLLIGQVQSFLTRICFGLGEKKNKKTFQNLELQVPVTYKDSMSTVKRKTSPAKAYSKDGTHIVEVARFYTKPS